MRGGAFPRRRLLLECQRRERGRGQREGRGGVPRGPGAQGTGHRAQGRPGPSWRRREPVPAGPGSDRDWPRGGPGTGRLRLREALRARHPDPRAMGGSQGRHPGLGQQRARITGRQGSKDVEGRLPLAVAEKRGRAPELHVCRVSGRLRRRSAVQTVSRTCRDDQQTDARLVRLEVNGPCGRIPDTRVAGFPAKERQKEKPRREWCGGADSFSTDLIQARGADQSAWKTPAASPSVPNAASKAPTKPVGFLPAAP